jgi:hypothetical protein
LEYNGDAVDYDDDGVVERSGGSCETSDAAADVSYLTSALPSERDAP